MWTEFVIIVLKVVITLKDTVLCVGEALIDFIPEIRSTNLTDVHTFQRMVGGAPANVAAAIAKLGGKSKLFTKLGNDPFGHYIVEELSNLNVDTSDILYDDQSDTSLAFVTLDKDGNRDFKFYRRSAADLQLCVDDIPRDIMENVKVLHFGSVDLVESPMKEVHNYLIKLAKLNDVVVSFDPNVRLDLWDDLDAYQQTIRDYLEYVDIIKVSKDELEFIAGTDNILSAVKYFFSKGIKQVVYTMGEAGARVYFDDMTYVEAPGVKVETVDTTGAGDAFIGTYLFMMTNSNLEHYDNKIIAYLSLLLANKCAAHACKSYGAINSYISKEQM